MSSSSNNDRHSGAKLLHVTNEIEEKKSDDGVRVSSTAPQAVELAAAAAARSPVSSTLATMSTLHNITLDATVRRSAIHDKLPPASSVGPSAAYKHSQHVQPDQTPSGHLKQTRNRSEDINNHDTGCGINLVHAMDYKQHRPTLQSQFIQSNQSVLRRGKWTAEEEAYANAVVREFNSGYLDAPAGTTLRIYLSEKLQCDPMRITKKFTGNDSIGKRVFHPTGRNGDRLTKEAKDAQSIIDDLYHKWKEKLEHQDREYARKTMAAQAVSQASLIDGSNQTRNVPIVNSSECYHSTNPHEWVVQKAILDTANWLSKAENALSKTAINAACSTENELRMISLLLQEAPLILATAADLPRLTGAATLGTTSNVSKRKHSTDCLNVPDSPSNPMKLLASISSRAAPVPIVQHDITNQNHSGSNAISRNASIADHEDAKTFVHFLQSMS